MKTKIMKQLIQEDILKFMKEIDDNLAYVSSKYKISIGRIDHYIDFLFFHIKFNCYVIANIKLTRIEKEDICNINKYMDYIDDYKKGASHGKTIGIILVKRKNAFVIEYTSDKRISKLDLEDVKT